MASRTHVPGWNNPHLGVVRRDGAIAPAHEALRDFYCASESGIGQTPDEMHA